AADHPEIGSHLIFEDDGPTITAVTNTGASVVHDETAGVQDTDKLATDIAFGTTNFGAVFTNVPSPGEDGDVAGPGAIGFAKSGSSLLTVGGNAGADGPAATELSYSLTVSNGTDSGLTTTDGVKIFLFNGAGSAAGLV